MQEFTTTFFNMSSDIVETPSWVDFELLGLYSGFAAALAGIGTLLLTTANSTDFAPAQRLNSLSYTTYPVVGCRGQSLQQE